MWEERIFPVLNKFDRIWSFFPNKTFCEIYMEVTGGFPVEDLAFTKMLDEYIDKYDIK